MRKLLFIQALFLLIFYFSNAQETQHSDILLQGPGQETLNSAQINLSVTNEQGNPGTSLLESSINLVNLAAATVSATDAGTTTGNLSVSQTGGANYTIPIEVPPGIRDVIPSLAISFNSQSGNGIAGWGWNISGLSTISRVGPTDFHDGSKDGVTLSITDRFALDGQRLLLKSGTYGVSGSEYQTEQYSNLRIKAYGTSPHGSAYGPSYFIVFYPDGSRAWYGSSNSHGKLEWAIYKWQDPQSNFIQYTYAQTNNLLRVTQIAYGSRSGTSAPNIINFDYKSRSRMESSYIHGELFKQTKILDNIEVIGKNNLYRKYQLQHNTTSLGYQTVASVQEFNGVNGVLAPITFTYGNTSDGIDQLTQYSSNQIFPGISVQNSETLTGDYNGDGRMDLISYSTSDRSKINVFMDLHQGSDLNLAWQIPTGNFKEIVSGPILSHNGSVLQQQGITTINETSGSGSSATSAVTFKTFAMASYGAVHQYNKTWNAPKYRLENDCDSNSWAATSKKFVSGDFNGDGLMDVIALTYPYTEKFCNPSNDCGGGGGGGGPGDPLPDPGDPVPIVTYDQATIPGYDCCKCTEYARSSIKSYFIDLDRSKTSGFSSYSGQLGTSLSASDRILAADITGNGKTELVQIKNGNIYVYALDNNNGLRQIASKTDAYIKTDTAILFGDFNGDGKMDMATPTANNNSTWRFFLFRGNDFYVYSKSIGINYRKSYANGGDLNEYHFTAQDFNGDGKTDILRHQLKVEASGYTVEFIKLYANVATTGSQPVFQLVVDQSYLATGSKKYGLPVYLDAKFGNPNPEYGYISGNKINVFEFQKDHRKDMALNSISNNGVVTNITYNALSPYSDSYYGSSVYYADYTESYPYVNVNNAPGLLLVKQLKVTGSNIWRQQDFAYQGAVTHATGLGFMGFKLLHRSNWYGDGVTRLWNSSEHDPQKRGATIVEWLANYQSTSPGTYASRSTYNYSTQLSSNKIFTNLVTQTITHNVLQGATHTETVQYDAYKNPMRVTTTNSAGATTEEYTYFNDTSRLDQYYHVGRPKTKKITSVLNGNSFVTEEAYTYTNNLLKTTKSKGAGTPWLTQTFSYDSFGNVTQKRLSASGMTTRTATYTYTADGRFMLTDTDVEALVTRYVNDQANGRLLSVEDPYGRVMTYSYDGWDRPISETDYLGKVTRYTYTQLSDGGTQTFINYDQGPDSYEYVNALGQLYMTNTLTLNGKWIKNSIKYDAVGRSTEVSEPYWATGSPSQWNRTYYDEWGRVIEQISHTGRTTNIVYDGLSTLVDDGTKSVTTTVNAAGNVTRVSDPGGDITYTYYGNGELKTADYGGQSLSTTIDAWGRRAKLVDPSAGTYTYEYNLYGELTKQTTPKGSTDYTLDGLGKPTKITIKGDETDLELNYSYNGDKLLTSIDGQDKKFGKYYNYGLHYDGLRRPVKITETNDLANFEKQLAYDGHGRVNRETYISTNNTDGTASTVVTTNSYDAHSGVPEQVRDASNNVVLWQLNAHDHRGQATSISLGNGYTNTRAYDSYGLPKSIRDTKGSGSSAQHALRMDYTFNAQRGVLDSRKNLGFDWTENFTHDDLDRLTDVNGPAPRNQTYDVMGRIGNNSSIGTYAYSNSKKYQLANVDLNEKGQTYYADRNTQEITYNAFKKPVDIHEENKGRVSFEYGVLGNRSHAWYGGLEEDKEERRYHKHYSAIMPAEIVEDTQTGNVKIITYLGGNAYSAPIAHFKSGSGGADGYHYLHRDYLGSILSITDQNGTVKEERQFGAWGTVDRFVNSDGQTDFGHDSLLGRGYTGHEHFFEVGLIHMNGRMYDAQLGRFLSPDNFIQDPYNTQSYNRYGYVMNNPLVYNDPSGETAQCPQCQEEEPGSKKWFEGEGWGAAIGNFVASVVNTVNWRSVGNWIGKQAKAIGDAIARPFREVGRFFRKLFGGGKRRSGPPPAVLAVPNARVSVDPLVRANPNIAEVNTAGGGIGGTGFVDNRIVSNTYNAPEQDFSGFWGGFNYLWTGGIVDGFRYNRNGEVRSVAPSMGIVNFPDKSSFNIIKGIRGFLQGFKGFKNAARGSATTWNGFQKMTAEQFATRTEAATAWNAYKSANGIVTGTTRSMAQRSAFLKGAAASGKYPSWMKPWLSNGKVPPGYHVDHYKALFDGGLDIPANMRLKDISTHINRHRYYRQ